MRARDATSIVGQQPLQARLLGRIEIAQESLGHDLLRGPEEALVQPVRHLVDAPPQEISALPRVRLTQPPAVLQLDHVPAVEPEDLLELHRLDDRDDAVEALAVEVDDPEDVPEAARLRLDDRLPDVALVELGVAEDGDEAPRPGAPSQWVSM